ncbi:MAG: shikimate kinase [bacterium]|nr:MAG: shikimate kinase [bacterium]
MNYKRVVLIGFRGAGKSTLAKLLAEHLGWDYISTDSQVEQKHHETIAEMVRKSGWEKFRQAEHEIINSLKNITAVVIDCGGGIIEDPENIKLLERQSLIVWVDADTHDLNKRIRDDRIERPLLTRKDMSADIRENYQRRRPLYEKYADFRVNSSHSSPEQLCRVIIQKLRDG